VAALKQRERSRIIAAAAILRSETPVVGRSVLGSSVFEDALTIERLRSLADTDKLPRDDVSPEDRLAATADLMIDVEPGSAPPGSAQVTIGAVRDATLMKTEDSCSMVVPSGPSPTLVLRASTVPAFLEISISELTVFQLRVVHDGFVGHPRDLALLDPGRYSIEVGAEDSMIQLSTYGATFNICGAPR
jgi:hypothetical protein